MRRIAKDFTVFIIGFSIVLILSAFLTPWLYSFLPFKFDRILRRLIMIGTLILTFGLIRTRRESLSSLGLVWNRESGRLLVSSFLVGTAIVAAMSAVQWALGVRFWQLHETDIWHWIGLFFKALGAGLLIGVIEEFFFRGFLFLTLKELWNTKSSLIVTNAVYSLVHFFPKGKVAIGAEPTAWDSFRIFQAMVPTGDAFVKMLPGTLGLFFFGLILSFAFLRKQSLFPAIGIHAGAVFGLKLNRRFVPEIADKMGIWTGSKQMYDGVAGLIVLALFALLFGIGLKAGPKKDRWKKGLAMVGILLLTVQPVTARAQDLKEDIARTSSYSFLDALPEAHVTRTGEGRSIEQAWNQGRLMSEELPKTMDVFATENIVVEGTARYAIFFQPLHGYDSALQFEGVPAGSKLHIFYALADDAFQTGKPVPAQFEVLIGKKQLFQTLVGSRGWHEKKIDLTLPSLLERRYRFSFLVRTADKNPATFVFYAYIE